MPKRKALVFAETKKVGEWGEGVVDVYLSDGRVSSAFVSEDGNISFNFYKHRISKKAETVEAYWKEVRLHAGNWDETSLGDGELWLEAVSLLEIGDISVLDSILDWYWGDRNGDEEVKVFYDQTPTVEQLNELFHLE